MTGDRIISPMPLPASIYLPAGMPGYGGRVDVVMLSDPDAAGGCSIELQPHADLPAVTLLLSADTAARLACLLAGDS
jgi:hypothetical protein